MPRCFSLILPHRSVLSCWSSRLHPLKNWSADYRCRHNGSATNWRYSGTAACGEINNCQQRLQLPYIPCVGLLAGGDFANDKRQEGGVAMASLRIVAFALALLGSSLLVGQASAAMPVNGLTEASKQISSVDKVWCCRGWRGAMGLPWMGLPSMGLRPMGLWLPPMVGPRSRIGAAPTGAVRTLMGMGGAAAAGVAAGGNYVSRAG